jgi:protein-L-isoaspartate(D-aspartate) O-methyltransferase
MARSAAILVAAALALPSSLPCAAAARDPKAWAAEREAMVRHIEAEGVRDSATLEAMRSVPRHEFVLAGDRGRAYGDHPLAITHGQTISQPYIVAYMTEAAGARRGMKVLEVGTGSGYQAAVLARIGCAVHTLEIFRALADEARARLARLGYSRVTVRHGDGHLGWAEEAPFDAILVTAAAGHVPPALVAQLRPGGRMVIPVGSVYGVQTLILVEKDARGEPRTRSLLPVRFVPMLDKLR